MTKPADLGLLFTPVRLYTKIDQKLQNK